MERPILFSTPMVQAILRGQKAQTRRVIKNRVSAVNDNHKWIWEQKGLRKFDGIPEFYGEWVHCPYGEKGDKLWVKETFCQCCYKADKVKDVCYKADLIEQSACNKKKFTTSLFMPRWASRITLEITDVRVEKLQNISESDAQDEGVKRLNLTSGIIEGVPFPSNRVHPMTSTYKEAYQSLWNSINGKKYPWESNCWVWVISFRTVQ